MFKTLNNTTDYTGKAKRFSVRGYTAGTQFCGTSENKPVRWTATLHGGFYEGDTAKTFRKCQVVKLDTGITQGNIETQELTDGDTLYIYNIPATKEQVEEIVDMTSDYDPHYEKPQVVIYGNGVKNITQTHIYMGSTGE